MKRFSVIIFILICETAGIVGSLYVIDSAQIWYPKLNQPSFTPQNWVFAPVWILLYAMMGVALYLIWNKGMRQKNIRTLVILFFLHLIVNIAWPVVFFGFNNVSGALLVIALLLVIVAYLTSRFWKVDHRAGLLLFPYLLWVVFAAALNFAFFVLN